jgi:hypothetical protein
MSNKEKENWVVRYIGAIDDNTDSRQRLQKEVKLLSMNCWKGSRSVLHLQGDRMFIKWKNNVCQ